jgi:NADH-quinone oxidoreductase subunit G
MQMLKKAGEFAGVRTDLECMVRIALRMGYDVRKLVPFSGEGTRADMGQTRGAQSGEADRHAVWLTEHNLEPKMSPYDPTAMLDEIQRLVPGYDISRLELLSGRDEHTQLVQITGATGVGDPSLVMPANDSLFTSGTLGRFSQTLNTVMERYEAPADLQIAAGDPMAKAGD